MDALVRIALLLAALGSLGAAPYRTANFVVTAPTADFAQRVGDAAEIYRKELAVAWVGRELPNWSAPCPIYIRVGHMGAGGATTFNFDRGEVFGWNMTIQGSEERILDSVLPHEISHTVFACHFRRPLPRWADEGAASLIEHDSERYRLKKLTEQVMGTRQQIPLRKLLAMTEYPTDMQQVLTLYAQGYSLADYLIQKGDKARYLKFLDVAEKQGWDGALRRHYGYRGVDHLEQDWKDWVLAGSPAISIPEGQQFVDAGTGSSKGVTIRAQTPDDAPTMLARNDSPSTGLDRKQLQRPVVTQGAATARINTGTDGRTQALHDGWVPTGQRAKSQSWVAGE